jgi:hypothetical protein
MLKSIHRLAAVALASIGLLLGAAAVPASAQNTQQSGLVNVSLTNTTVQVPVAVAANVCNVTANVIAANNFTPNGGPCTATSTPSASGGGGGGGNTSQQGLVNVSLTNTTVQIPIGVAANVCNVTANVLASGNFTPNGGPCTAVARPSAQA